MGASQLSPITSATPVPGSTTAPPVSSSKGGNTDTSTKSTGKNDEGQPQPKNTGREDDPVSLEEEGNEPRLEPRLVIAEDAPMNERLGTNLLPINLWRLPTNLITKRMANMGIRKVTL